MGYQGDERRIHKVIVTQNTEYHLRRDECVAVRDRDTGTFVSSHRAVKRRIRGSMRFFANGSLAVSNDLPSVGDALCFADSSLVTSRVVSVERPPKDIVRSYSN